MNIEFWLGGITAAGLLAYLTYALVYPERF